MTTYRYQIRSYAAPLGANEYEIISTHDRATDADKEFCRLYGGTTGALDHSIVVIDDAGRVYSLEEAPAAAIAQFAE
jgi:hypothetical protein